MRSEPEIDRVIHRFEHGNGRGIDGVFAVGKLEGNALRLFDPTLTPTGTFSRMDDEEVS